MAQISSSAQRMRKLRERKRCGSVFVQFELKRAGVETLIARGLLDDDAANDPAQIHSAVVRLLNETLSPEPQPFRQALKAVTFGLF